MGALHLGWSGIVSAGSRENLTGILNGNELSLMLLMPPMLFLLSQFKNFVCRDFLLCYTYLTCCVFCVSFFNMAVPVAGVPVDAVGHGSLM